MISCDRCHKELVAVGQTAPAKYITMVLSGYGRFLVYYNLCQKCTAQIVDDNFAPPKK